MENFPLPSQDAAQDAASSMSFYPPKFQEPEKSNSNVWLKSVTSLALYLILGYYIFQSFEMLLLITAIVVIHEMGHFFAMKFFRYKDLGIFFIPLLGAYVSGSKREVSQRESAIITLAGPLPGIVIGILFYWFWKADNSLFISGISFHTIALSFILLNLINLIPVYPLDGGQLLNRVFLDEDSWISKGFVLLSIAALTWFALYGFNRPFYPLLVFPAMMLFRMFGDAKLNTVDQKIEEAGIDMNKSYEELPDEDYWKVRNILVTAHPGFHDVPLTPPYAYHIKEEKIMNTIQGLLHRHLIQDVSWLGKLLIVLIWVAAIASPWLIGADMSFMSRFGF